MPGWGSDDEGDTAATAPTPITVTNNNNNNDSWGSAAADDDQQDQEQPPHQDIQAQPMSLDSLSLIQPKQDGLERLERFPSKAIIRVFLLPLASYCPISYQTEDPWFSRRDRHIAAIGRDTEGDYYFLHRDGRRMFDKPWAKTWTPVSEEPINKLKRNQSAVYLATDGPTHYYYDLREFLTTRSIISLSGNLYVPTSQGMHDYTRIQIELDDNLEIAKQCSICLKWETEWEMQDDGQKKRLEIKSQLERFLPCRGCKKQVYCSIACHRTGWESHNHKLKCLATLFGDWSSASTYWAIDDASTADTPAFPAAAAAASPAYEGRAETPGKEQTMDWEPAAANTTNSTAHAANGAWGSETPAPTSSQAQDGENEAWDSPPPPPPSSASAPSTPSVSAANSTMPTSSASVAAIPAAPASAATENAWASPIPASGVEIRNSASWGGDIPLPSKTGVSTTTTSNDAWGSDTPLPASGLSNSVTGGSAWADDAITPIVNDGSAPSTNSAWGSGSSPPRVSAQSSSTQGWGGASATEGSNSGGWGSSDSAPSFGGGRGGFRGGEGRGRGGFRGGEFRGGGGRGRGRGGDFVPRESQDGGWGGFRGRGRGRGRGNEGGQSFNGGHRGAWAGQNSYNSNNTASSDSDTWGSPTCTTQAGTSGGWGSSSAAPSSSDSTATSPAADTWASKVDEGVGLNGSNKDNDNVWGEGVTAADSNAKTGADAWD